MLIFIKTLFGKQGRLVPKRDLDVFPPEQGPTLKYFLQENKGYSLIIEKNSKST